MNCRVLFSCLEDSNKKTKPPQGAHITFVRICLVLIKDRESGPKKECTHIPNHSLLGILKERNKSRKSWDEDREQKQTPPPRFFSINRAAADKEGCHGGTAFQHLGFFSKRTWEPTLGKGRECPECSAQGWHIPSAGGRRQQHTSSCTHSRDSRNIYWALWLQMLAERTWKRLDLEIQVRPSKNYFKSII